MQEPQVIVVQEINPAVSRFRIRFPDVGTLAPIIRQASGGEVRSFAGAAPPLNHQLTSGCETHLSDPSRETPATVALQQDWLESHTPSI
jgi:hypothetical protein